MARHNELGKWGERVALEHYLSCGYVIRETNWRINHLEIDLIVTKGMRMVFVEVKTRRDSDFADPLTAVTKSKKSHLIAAADIYMRNLPGHETFDWQFDVFVVVGTPDSYTTELIADAFMPSLKRMCR